MGSRRFLISLAMVLTALRAPVWAAEPPPADLDRQLARPLTPGTIGLLVEHTTKSPALARLVAGLGDSRPETRVAAARVIWARGLVALRPHVLRALAIESDGDAANEMIRAATQDLRQDELAEVIEAVRGLPVASKASLALALSESTLPMESLLGSLKPLECCASILVDAVARSGDRRLAPVAMPSVEAQDAGLFMALLRRAEPPQLMDPEVLARALTSENAEIRTAAAWYVALRYRRDRGPGGEQLGQVLSTMSQGGASDSFLTAVALARRALGGRPEDDPVVIRYAQEIAKDDASAPVASPSCRFALVRDLLGPKEVAAAKRLLEGCDVVRRKGTEFREHMLKSRGPSVYVRTLTSEVPRAMLAGVVEESGCKLDDAKVAIGGIVRYRADGRPDRISLPADTPPDECGTALRALLWVTRGWTAAEPALYLLPLKPRQFACTAAEPVFPPVAEGDEVREAQIVRQEFPRGIKRQRSNSPFPMGAMVTCTVSASGCVSSIQTAVFDGSPGEVFAVSEAILGWEFKPGTRNGKPQDSFLRLNLDMQGRKATVQEFRTNIPARPNAEILYWTE